MSNKIEQVVIECIRGDIVAQEDIDIVVNAANAELRTGGGVAGAVHRGAGPKLEMESQKHAPIAPGEAVITKAYNLPNKYVIHCLGPVYGLDSPEDKLLGDCYRKALMIAEEKELYSIAFPAISTGAFGYPIEEAAEVVFTTIKELIPNLKSVKIIRFVLHSKRDLDIYKIALNQL